MIEGVRWFSIPPGSGYGNAAADYLDGLRAARVPVSWTVLGWPSTAWPDRIYGPVVDPGHADSPHADVVDVEIRHDVVVVHSTPLWDERLRCASPGQLLVAYTTWETDRLGEESVDILNRYDLVLVPSRFNREVFELSGVRVPLVVVPHVARDPGTPAPRPSGDGARYVFYTIASWTTRKAILDTVSAFTGAFGSDDPVVLRIHTTREDHVAGALSSAPLGLRAAESSFSLARALAGRDDLPEIVLSTRPLSREAVDALHRSGDCFVSSSRGEGWGLAAFEAASFGRPVIVTGWGGTVEFLPPGYPYLVDFRLVPTTDEEPDRWWRPAPGERWAKADVAHASALMRRAYEHRREARTWGERTRRALVSQFGRERVTARLLEALEDGAARQRDPQGVGFGRLRPMASHAPLVSEDLEVHETEDGVIVYQESTDRVHHLNHTAAVILRLCDGRRDAAGIAAEVAVLFGLDEPPVDATAACLQDLVREGIVCAGSERPRGT